MKTLNYLQRLIESSEEYGLDILASCREMLENAQHCLEHSMEYFEQYDESGNRYYWTECRFADSKAEGLIESYNILAGRDIHTDATSIDLELLQLDELIAHMGLEPWD